MSVSSVSSSSYSTSDSSREVSTTLGSEDFLELLAVQLTNQDPMNPMDDTEFISQMANFSSLEAMSELSESFESFSQNQQEIAAQAYLGKVVTIEDDDDEIEGEVTALTNDDSDGLLVTVDNENYSIDDIRRVELTTTSDQDEEASE
jgi:flagellar basal-body rod modification protein FlgD